MIFRVSQARHDLHGSLLNQGWNHGCQELSYRNKKNLFAVTFAVSLIAWIVLVVTIIGIFYVLFIGLFLFFAHALMIAHVKGLGVKLSEKQFPEIYAKVVAASNKLGLKSPPEVLAMGS
jgi:hypothetical protein